MNRIKVYLMGSCKNVSVEESSIWRNYIAKTLDEQSSTLVAFNPNEHFSYDKNNPNNEGLVMDFFLYNLSESKIAVINLNNSNESVGTGIEFGKALAEGKFIIGFGNSNSHDYMKERCSVIFDNEREVIEFLLQHYN